LHRNRKMQAALADSKNPSMSFLVIWQLIYNSLYFIEIQD
jgi:hypothetical protein